MPEKFNLDRWILDQENLKAKNEKERLAREQRMNLARIEIRQAVTGYLEDHIFPALMYNTHEERERVENDVSEIIEEIKTRPEAKLFEDYKVVCDETNNTPDVIDAHSLKIDVYVQPLKRQEYVCMMMTVMPQRVHENLNKETHGQVFCEIDPYGEEDWEES